MTMVSDWHELENVGAGANVLSFGRFQNADGFRGYWRAGGARGAGGAGPDGASGFGAILTAVALALDQNGLDVV